MDIRVLLSLVLVVGVAIGSAAYFTGGEPENGNLLAAAAAFQGGGYDRSARIFNGTGVEWCSANSFAANCLGQYSPLPIIFGWDAAWDRGTREAWANGPYDATLDVIVGGEKYHVTWAGTCTSGQPKNDGICVWGEFSAVGEAGAHPLQGAGALWFSAASPDRF